MHCQSQERARLDQALLSNCPTTSCGLEFGFIISTQNPLTRHEKVREYLPRPHFVPYWCSPTTSVLFDFLPLDRSFRRKKTTEREVEGTSLGKPFGVKFCPTKLDELFPTQNKQRHVSSIDQPMRPRPAYRVQRTPGPKIDNLKIPPPPSLDGVSSFDHHQRPKSSSSSWCLHGAFNPLFFSVR